MKWAMNICIGMSKKDCESFDIPLDKAYVEAAIKEKKKLRLYCPICGFSPFAAK